MKYCLKCGTLLEDTVETCIGCGSNVSEPTQYSKYPPRMQKKLDAEKQVKKKKNSLLVAIIAVFVLIVLLVCLIIFYNPASTGQVTEETPVAAETEAVGEVTAEVESEPSVPTEEPTAVPDKNVNDEQGSYYFRGELTDEGGNNVCQVVYPEDFSVEVQNVDCTRYSDKFPMLVTFTAQMDDDSVRFSYLSPQQFWYKDSETGDTRKNERDIINYMSYYTYDGGEGYADALIKASYPKAKNVTLKETEDVTLSEEALSQISSSMTKMLGGDIGDYAHIGEDTIYATMKSDYSAKIYHYEQPAKDNSKVFFDIYIPLLANNLYYSSDAANDRGTMIEWITLGAYIFEAGNEDLYDDYLPAFRIFCDNTNVNGTFYSICEQYAQEIKRAIKAEESPKELNGELLKEYAKNNLESLSELNTMFCDFTGSRAGENYFSSDLLSAYAPKDFQISYYDDANSRFFFSPSSEEFPGSEYTELTLQGQGETAPEGEDVQEGENGE